MGNIVRPVVRSVVTPAVIHGAASEIGGPQLALRIAATLGRVSGANADGGNDGTNTQHLSRNAHRTGLHAVKGMRVVAANFRLLGTAPYGEEGVGNAITYRSEIEISGVNTAALWDGETSLSVADKSLAVSDPILDIVAGQLFYTRHWVTVADTSMKWPRAQSISANGQRGVKGTDLSSYFAGTGALVGGTTDAAHPPLALLGLVPRSSVAVVYTGPSIEDGSGDLTTISADGATGYVGRGLEGVNGFNIPSCKMTRGGETMQALADPVSGALRRFMLKYGTHFICGSQTNDCLSSAARSIAQIQADCLTVWSAARAAGVQKIYQCNIIPRTNSTDGWTTPENQTPYTNFEPNGTSHRDALNAWFLTKVADGTIDGVIDFAADCEDPENPGKWRTDLGAGNNTADGVHPHNTIHSLGATRVNALASTWTAF